jgi:hypothetical protein
MVATSIGSNKEKLCYNAREDQQYGSYGKEFAKQE